MSDHRGSTKGPSQRQNRVAELIRHSLAEIFSRGEIHDPDLAGLYPSFHEVRMSPDLKLATIYVSSLGRKRDADLLAVLKRQQKTLRHLVAGRIQMRYVPELRFRLDETMDEVIRIEALLDSDKVRQDLEKSQETDIEDEI